MAESKPVDYLPPGWTIKERVRGNGKRDKYYYAPSNGPVFNSRREVSRYLGAEETNQTKANRKKKLKHWKIISVERVSIDDLPPGWIGEILVKKRDHIIRRESYYIPPESKTVLRSLKAVSRYLEAREPATPSEYCKGIEDERLEDDSILSAEENKKGQLLVSTARRQINFDQISNMNETELDHQRVGEDTSDKETDEDGLLTSNRSGMSRPRKVKSNKTKAYDLPRRSKRLAGVQLDQIELKPRTRKRRVAAEQLGNQVSIKDEASNPNFLFTEPETKCSIESWKKISNYSFTSEKQIKCDERQTYLGEFLMDPCIAFAIKTLTEVNFDGLENSEALIRNNSDRSSMNFTTDLFESYDNNTACKQVGLNAVPLEHSQKVESKTNSSESSFRASRKDTCINLAVKTLTDRIPLVYSPNFQQRLSTAETQAGDETNSTNINGSDNSGHTDLLRRQFHNVKKPGLQSFSDSRVGLGTSGRSVLNQNGNNGQ